MTDTRNVRLVTVRGVRYLRLEDVADMIYEMAAAEEVDVRKRFQDFSRNLHGLANKRE